MTAINSIYRQYLETHQQDILNRIFRVHASWSYWHTLSIYI